MPLLRKYHKLCLLLAVLGLISFKDLEAKVPTITSFSPTSGFVGTSVNITGTNFNPTANQNPTFFTAITTNLIVLTTQYANVANAY